MAMVTGVITFTNSTTTTNTCALSAVEEMALGSFALPTGNGWTFVTAYPNSPYAIEPTSDYSGLHARITLLDKEDKVITHLGDDPEWRKVALSKGFRGKRDQWKAGRFVHPHDACFDEDGNIFVAEWVSAGRVTKLRKVI